MHPEGINSKQIRMTEIQSLEPSRFCHLIIWTYNDVGNNLLISLSPGGRGRGRGGHAISTPTSILPRQGGG
jgi:hypothetical protein